MNSATHLTAAAVLGASLIAVSAASAVSASTGPAAGIGSILRRELDEFPTLPGELVAVVSSGPGPVGPVVEVVEGYDGAVPAVPADATVRIASVTKTFTAAAVLRLVEDGAVRLSDDLAAAGVPTELLDLLRADGYAVDDITIAQLLDHTSGIADFADNASGVAGGAYGAAVLADPTHHWTRREQVAFAVDHHDPVADPGTVFHYSDTGYVLLGAVLEAATGTTLGAALRELLDFAGLGLRATYLDDGVDHPLVARPAAPQWIGGIDGRAVSPTVDLYGGGGLVSTMGDLATFVDALLSGRVLRAPETLTLLTATSGAAAPAHAASGLFEAHVGAARCWYHDGFWGVQVLSCPGLGVTVARSWGQAVPPDGFDPAAALLAIVERVAVGG